MQVEVHGHPDTDKVINTLAQLLCHQRGLEFKGVTREEKNDDYTSIAVGGSN